MAFQAECLRTPHLVSDLFNDLTCPSPLPPPAPGDREVRMEGDVGQMNEQHQIKWDYCTQ